MKKIKFTCSNCQAKLRVPTHLAGISAPCPKCGRKITAPTDLDSIVDDDPAPKPKQRAVRKENDAAPRSIPASRSAAAVADAPPRTEAPPRRPESPAPAVVSASSPSTISVPEPQVMNEAPSAPAPAPPAAPQPVPTVPEPQPTAPEPQPTAAEEPIIEETLLTPPTPPTPAVSEMAMPLEDTQPIQVNPLPGSLPEVKHDHSADSQSLPRLDAERLADETAPQTPTAHAPATPTKLHLPQEGDLTGQQSPQDFIVPAAQELPVPSPAPEPVEEESRFIPPPEPVFPDLSDLDMSSPGTPMEELGEQPRPEPAVNPDPGDYQQFPTEPEQPEQPEQPVATQQFPPELEQPVATQQTTVEMPVEPAADENSGVGSTPETYPSAQAAPQPEAPAAEPEPSDSEMIQLGQEQAAPAGLSSGSMERLLSEQTEADETVPISTPPAAETTAARDELDDMFEAPAATRESSSRSDSQSLEEMFGEIPADGGKKKLTKVVMFSMIGAVVIISIVVVIIAGNAAGGFGPPQITSNQNEVTPPPRISEIPPTSVTDPGITDAPEISDAPAVIDPVAQERVEENAEGITRSTTTLPGDTSEPVVIADSPPAVIDPPSATESVTAGDTPALSFDERVQQIVNGSGNSDSQMNIIGGEAQKSPLDSLDDTIASLENGASTMVDDVAAGAASELSGGNSAAAASAAAASNYNPPAAFPAPGPDDAPLGRTHDLLDAFLRAPDWQSRIPYVYQGESLRPVIEEYYKKWPITSFERFSLSLFQMEQDTALGGPYWVYLVSTNDLDQGYPVIIRVEDGNLKVDWEIYSEFQDQHFVEFQEGAIASPHTFRLVIERVSDYFGSDRDDFTNLDDYLVYQINPPYGDLSEYSEYAFVRKDSELAGELDAVVGLNDEPLAVIVTIEQKVFDHGEKHLEITDYVTEGWFR